MVHSIQTLPSYSQWFDIVFNDFFFRALYIRAGFLPVVILRFFFLCVLGLHVYLCHIHVVPMEDRKGPKIPIHSCEPLCGCWESKIGSLEELSLLLTAESPPHFRAVCNLLFLAEINTRTK